MAIRMMYGVDSLTEEALISDAVMRRLPRHSWLFYEGDHTDDVYLVIAGLLKMMKTAADGSEVMLAIRGAGDLVGELSVFDARPRLVSAVTMTETSVLPIDRDRFSRVMDEHPGLTLVLLADLAGQLRSVALQTLALAAGDATVLVSRRLFQLASGSKYELLRSQQSGRTVVDLPFSQHELATWAGVSLRSTVATLSQLRQDGIITTSRLHFEVLDLDRLRSSAGIDVSIEPP